MFGSCSGLMCCLMSENSVLKRDPIFMMSWRNGDRLSSGDFPAKVGIPKIVHRQLVFVVMCGMGESSDNGDSHLELLVSLRMVFFVG